MMEKTDVMAGTARLVIRRWRESDTMALYACASDGRVSELALWPCHTSPEMSLAVIREIFMPNPHTFAIVLKETGEAVGCIGLVPSGCEHHPVAPGEREVGYWLGYPMWGRGLATEALRALIPYCRDRLGLASLLITTDARNLASQRVALKCGFRHLDDYTHDNIPSKSYRLPLTQESATF